MATGIYSTPNKNAVQKVLDSTLSAGATSAVLTEDVSALFPDTTADHPCVFVIDRIDANGNLTPTKREYISFTGVTTTTLTGLTRNADSSGSDQEHAVGAIVEFVPDVLWAKSIKDNLVDVTSAHFNLPEGVMSNGLIVPSVASNNLTVALKGLDGNDPSATNPIYIRIGDTVRSITAALSATWADGTNWCNAGSTELATKEIDYFVYLVWNASSSSVNIGFSRIPYAGIVGDFSSTTNGVLEKALLMGTGYNTVVAGDSVVNIGRFAATLSAGAGYTWSVPTFTATNLIQRPIYETRWLTWLPTFSSSSVAWTYAGSGNYKFRYMLRGRTLFFIFAMNGTLAAGTNATSLRFTLPMDVSSSISPQDITFPAWVYVAAYIGGFAYYGTTRTIYIQRYDNGSLGNNGNAQGFTSGTYEI